MLLFLVAVIAWLVLYMVFPPVAIGIAVVAGLVVLVLSIVLGYWIIDGFGWFILFLVFAIIGVAVVAELNERKKRKNETSLDKVMRYGQIYNERKKKKR